MRQMKTVLGLLLMLMMTLARVADKEPGCVFCLRRYHDCLTKNKCNVTENIQYMAYCERGFNECMKWCVDMLKRIKTEKFPSPWEKPREPRTL